MSSRQYPSGSSKRKMKLKREEQVNKYRGSLDSFVKKKSLNLETDVLPNSANSGTDFNLSRKDVNMSVNVSNNDDDINYEFNILEKQGFNIHHEYPTDRFYFEENIQNIAIKKCIISYGPCRPKIVFPITKREDGSSYHFSSYYYEQTLKSGVIVPSLWLCYSVGLDCVYCETCWLFANRHYSYFQKAWINGVNDWPNLTNKITTHEKSLQHIEASKTRALWKQNETIDKISERQYSEETLFWRNVLERIIKIIIFLTAGNTALRGHEHKQKCNSEHFDGEGNFMRSVRLLAEYDPIINQLLNDEKKKVKYFSWKVQNEVIELLATNIRNHICDEIRNSQCFSIIMDSTQDIVKLDQVSVVIRYVVINYDDLDISIKESFLGFFKIDKHGAQDYKELISEILLMFKIDINKCRGQGYDGASVMSGVYSGVQKRIKDKVPNAGSAPRWAILAFGDDQSKRIKTKVLKKLCPTRWESRHESLYALKSRFIDVLKALTNMSLTSTKTEERNISLSLKKKLESEHILRPLHVVSKILQNPHTNLHSACRNLKNAKEVIQNLRNDYEITILSECKHLCVKWGISMNFHVRRQKFAVKHFDEVEGDRRLSISDENFRVKIVLPVIDMVLFQLNLRFERLRKVTDNFDFLFPTSLIALSDNDLAKASMDFFQLYQSDISSDFTRQLLCIKDQLIPQKIKSIKELTLYIIKNNLCTTFFDVLSACIIYLTLPVTVASAERSFSKLKLIKNYLRNNMGQDRLSNIAVLNIEKDVAAKFKLDHVINTFANSKARKIDVVKDADELAKSITVLDALMWIKQSVKQITGSCVTKRFKKSGFILENLPVDLDNTDLENEIIVGEQLVNMLPTHMQGEEFFLVDKNLRTEEDSTDIKSFITTDNDEEETHEETEEIEEPEDTVSNYSEVLTQIKQLLAFTLQKGDVDGYDMLKTVEMYFEKKCSNNQMNLKQTNITQFF
ncbi:hypothetical protein QTP88_000929 [Uroleucon formosanum]